MNCYVDEVGYGSIAGPIIVCAVVERHDAKKIEGVKDSKKLSAMKRESLFDTISSKVPHAYGAANIKLMKMLNIHYARYQSMKEAIEKLLSRGITINKVIVDGKFEIPNLDLEQEPVIKADEKYWQVGAASILAKVTRDRLMANLAKTVDSMSYYGWENNAGYYTPEHRDGIIEYGATSLHRRNHSFFKYAMFEHREFIKSEKTFEEYKRWMQTDGKPNGQTRYAAWKADVFNSWKPIIWVNNGNQS